jgi:TPP-dependent pyruvate/acetoin dehydrogenase alpha subunit
MTECQGLIEEALNFADQSPYPSPADALEDVWA